MVDNTCEDYYAYFGNYYVVRVTDNNLGNFDLSHYLTYHVLGVRRVDDGGSLVVNGRVTCVVISSSSQATTTPHFGVNLHRQVHL